MADTNTVVIGAGISGLITAYQLKNAGVETLVLDQNSRVGGRMFTIEWNGFRLDPGASIIMTSDKFLLDLVRELDLESQITDVYDSGLVMTILRDGELHTVDFLSVSSYLSWQGVSLGARLSMIKLLPQLLPLLRLKQTYHLEALAGKDSESLEEFLYKHAHPEMFEYWAGPMFEVMCAYSGQDLSGIAFLGMTFGSLNANTLAFKDGIGVVPEAIAKRLDIELNARVSQVSPLKDKGGVEIEYFSKQGKKKKIKAEKVVVAIPGSDVLALFEEPRPAWKAFFPQVRYTKSATQYSLVEMDEAVPNRAVYFPRNLKMPVNSVTHFRRSGKKSIFLTDPSISIYKPTDDEKTLVQRAEEGITTVYPYLKGQFLDHHVIKWPHKVPAFYPGYLQHLKEFWENPQEGPVYFCGDYFASPSTGGALFTGLEAAERVLDSM